MFRFFGSVLIAVAVLFFSTTASLAIPKCGPTDVVTEHFKVKYKEPIVWTGLADPKFGFQLFVSPKGTWTLVRFTARGTSCVLTAGKYADHTPDPPKI